MLTADILPQCIAGSFDVHRSTICCNMGTDYVKQDKLIIIWGKNDLHPTDQVNPISEFIFAEKTNMPIIMEKLNSHYYGNEV